MAVVVVTLKVMPTGPEVDMDKLYVDSEKIVRAYVDEGHKEGEIRKEIEEIGFGLKSLKIIFVMDESMGGTDKLEEQIKALEDAQSVETIDVRRAIG